MDISGAEDRSIYHEEKEACWRPKGLSPLVTLQGWVLSTLSWQGLALLVTLLLECTNTYFEFSSYHFLVQKIHVYIFVHICQGMVCGN